VSRLVDAELAAARERDRREQAPSEVSDGRAGDSLFLHRRDERPDVVAHQVELVHVVLLARVHGDLRRGQPEDQPSAADVEVREADHVAQKRAVGLRVGAVENRMGADDSCHFLDHPAAV